MKNEKPTLIILTPGFPKDETDSTCLPSQQLFAKMLKEKYSSLEVVIISFQYPYVEREYNWHGCKIIAMGGKRKGGLFRVLLWRRVWRRLKKLKSCSDIKGILSFWCGECALVGNRFSKRYNIKHHCWLLGQDAQRSNKYVARIKPAAEELIAMSDFLAETFYSAHGILPAHIIENGISVQAFQNAVTERAIDILGAGSLIPLKQYELFIEIIKAIKKTFPSIKAVIAGKGVEEKKLRLLITSNELDDNLSLTGELPHDETLKLMQRSRIFLHSSRYEGFSTVCLEALAAGCRVLSFTQAMRSPVQHWEIFSDKETMQRRVIEILNDKSMQYYPVFPFTMESAVSKIMQLYLKEFAAV